MTELVRFDAVGLIEAFFGERREPHAHAAIFPTLASTELKQLSDDIAKNGLLEPIVMYEGQILDGRNRYAACGIAGVIPRLVEYEGEDPMGFVVSMNLHRRHLSTSQRAIVAAELSGPPTKGGRPETGTNGPVSRDEAARLLNVSEKSVKRAAALIEADSEIAEEIKVGQTEETVSGALKRVKRKQREAALGGRREKKEALAREQIGTLNSPYELAIADVRDWRPENVSAIITDPPYVGDSIPLYEALRDFAVDVLPEGAPLVVMTWQAILPDVIEALRHDELAYRWTICWRYANTENTVDYKRRVFDCWKPVLVYHKGAVPTDARMFRDEIANAAPDKDFHEWGQSVDGFERLVTSFSEPGEIVCDPFLGGGTTAIAALAQARRFAGCDIDLEAVATSKKRLVA